MDKLKAMFSGSSSAPDDARTDAPPPLDPLGTAMPEVEPDLTAPPRPGRDDESA